MGEDGRRAQESEEGWRESRVEELEEENKKLKDENYELQEKFDKVKSQLQERNKLKKSIEELKTEINEQKNKIEELEKKSSDDEETIRDLRKQINDLKEKKNRLIDHLKFLQECKKIQDMMIEGCLERGEICNYSCVLDALYWICRKKLPSLTVKCSCGHSNCRRKLEKILTHNAHDEIGKDDLDCHKLIYILEKSDIVQQVGEFDYPQGMDAENRDKIIHDAWQKILEEKQNNTRVLILGRKWVGEIVGHVVVCDLEARPEDDSTVVVYDPQKGEVRTEDEEKFKTSVINDIQLQLYTVNFNVFEEIIKRYYDTTDDTLNANAIEALDLQND